MQLEDNICKDVHDMIFDPPDNTRQIADLSSLEQDFLSPHDMGKFVEFFPH